jgi:hypothetical protein
MTARFLSMSVYGGRARAIAFEVRRQGSLR